MPNSPSPNDFLNNLSGEPDSFVDDSSNTPEESITNASEEQSSSPSEESDVTKFFVIRKLIELFLEIEKGEKKDGRKEILFLCKLMIWFIVIFEAGIILAQGLGYLKLNNIVFLGTIGTITSGIIFVLKIVTKSLYNDESDKVLKTVETIISKL